MCSNAMNKLENISLDEFKKQLETLESFVTDPQWLVMLKYDMALNSDLASKLCDYIIYIKNNHLDAEAYEKLILNIRQECELKIQEAIDERNPATKWYKYREAYAYYGFIETITEGSIITDQILETFRKKYGENYLNVLKDIDTINPSNLTNFDLSSDNISSYNGEEVKLYLLMKYWQDNQHIFHEKKLHPKHQEARKNFEKVVREELPSLNDVSGKNLLALYLISNTDILSINVLSRFILGGLDNDLALIVGGKNLGLARLNAHGFEIPETYFISVNSLEKKLYLSKLKELKDYNYSVRSSATVEDNENQSFAGMFNSVLDVPKADLEKAIKIVGDSVTNSRVLAYVKHFKTKSPKMSVVLQKFKEPQFSGVWIGKEINAGYLEWTNGNGEKLVSGRIKPTSENWPSKNDKVLRVKDKAIGESCLEVQKVFSSLADLEWCILDGKLVWLQYRPVTKRINREDSVEIPDAYDGVAASSGIVQGKPIYLEDTSDSDAFEAGAILLTDYTDPDWVPIMMKSSAIITAEGGFLSHTAIICRELGIPCVTGLGYDVIEDLSEASMIEVNGSSGKVRKIPRS